MRVVTNETLVKRNKRMATYLFFVSLVILIIGFFAANGVTFGLVPEAVLQSQAYVLTMPLILLVGFATTLTSVRMTNLWVRVPRPEHAIPEGLKGLSNKAVLYNYHHIPARHVLVAPQGIFPIITRFQDGRFAVNGSRWRTFKGPISAIFTFLRLDGVGNPTRDAKMAEQYVRYLTEDFDDTLPIQPLIVFTDPRAEVQIEDPDVPVLFASTKKEPNLKDYVKSYNNGETIEQFKGDGLKEFIEEWEYATLE